MRRASLIGLTAAALGVGACAEYPGDGDMTGGDGESTDGKADDALGFDIARTDLELDIGARRGTATIDLVKNATIDLEVGDLTITSVTDGRGNRQFTVADGRLRVTNVYAPVTIEYEFREHNNADGLLPGGSTVLWPYHCGNLFPCQSSPRDGAEFSLSLSGVPSDQKAIYPRSISADAPAYQVAFAIGAYEQQHLGTTGDGTRVHVSWLPGGKTAALAGTRRLVAAFDWFEQELGRYRFGRDVGSVSVVWGEGMYGGMEHHPHWHVATDAMGDEVTHIHEAAHGWFGDGIRLRCWEDFVLSEGTVTYLTARALGQLAGPAREAEVWAGYQEELDAAVADRDHRAWPAGCGNVDILADGLFSNIPYMRGAFFYKHVAEAIGAETLDGVLAEFYGRYAGRAAGMQDMLDMIAELTDFDANPLADAWLRTPN